MEFLDQWLGSIPRTIWPYVLDGLEKRRTPRISPPYTLRHEACLSAMVFNHDRFTCLKLPAIE
jgi:hypothetical protein